MAQLEKGAAELEFVELGRGGHGTEANLLDEGLIARVGVNKVEESVILDVDEVGIVLPEGFFEIFTVSSLSPV